MIVKIKNFFILLTLLSLIFFISGCDKLNQKDNQPAIQSAPPTQLQLEEQYQSKLKEILQPYRQNKEVAGLKDKIIDLRSPAKYLDLHFNLVIAFESIEQGQADSDQAKIEAGLEKIDKLIDQYSWLK